MHQGDNGLFIALISTQESSLLSYLKPPFNVPASDFVPVPVPVYVSGPEPVPSTTAPAPAPALEEAIAPEEALKDQQRTI